MTETTRDALLGGQLVYHQPKKGYRVGLEAPLLAHFALPARRKPPRCVVDLGAGPGAVGLVVSHHVPRAQVTLVEQDALHADLASRNVIDNNLTERVRVVCHAAKDIDREVPRGTVDLVVTNPPWFDVASGRSPTDARRASARMLPDGVMREFVVAAKNLLGRGGRVCLSLPAPSLARWLSELGKVKLVAKRLRFVHPRFGEPANVVLVDAMSGREGGLLVSSPLIIRNGEEYTDEARDILWPRPPGDPAHGKRLTQTPGRSRAYALILSHRPETGCAIGAGQALA